MDLSQMIAGLYILMIILTARCLFIWVDDDFAPITGAFLCLMVSLIWPVIWLIRFVVKGLSNPFIPWRK